MKKTIIWIIFITAVLVFVFLFFRALPGERREAGSFGGAIAMLGITNLVANPSFENADPKNPELPAGFTPERVPGKDRLAKLTWEEPGYSGKKAIAVETLASNDLGYWETIIPVKPATEYIISFYYKCESVRPREIKAGDPEYNKGRAGGPNLELGVVPDDASELAQPKSWTDIGIALGPVGGVYLSLATEWSLYQQRVKTAAGQTRLRVKLRLYCYAQKVWFDDLSIVAAGELPKVKLLSPEPDAVVESGRPKFKWEGEKGGQGYIFEYSPTPAFSRDTTKRVRVQGESLALNQPLAAGTWYWHVGVGDKDGVVIWLAGSFFRSGERSWVKNDTTPPGVFSPKPLPNDKVGSNAVISVKFSDGGSGINVSSAKILLDGMDVSAQTEVTPESLTLRPEKPLAKGAHRVEASIADKAGNRSNVLAWQFGVDEFFANNLRIEGKNTFLNDRPYFPIGIYCYQCSPGDGRFVESALAQAAEAGFDVVVNTLETKAGLDKEFVHGMRALLNISVDMKGCDTVESARTSLLNDAGERGQARFRAHPAVIGYYADDPENVDNTDGTPIPESSLAKMNNTRKVLKESEPRHPIIAAIGNLSRLKASVPFFDILLSYRYPIPHMHPQMIYGWTLAYICSVVDQTYVDTKPVWFNPQAFDLGEGAQLKSTEGFRPTPAEMRVMAYYSLVVGVKGYAAYAGPINAKDYPAHWRELLKMAGEMRYLAPVLAAGEPGKVASLKEDSSSGSVYFREIECGNTHTLIAVNMSGAEVAAGWSCIEPVQVKALFEDRLMSGKSKEINDLFKPYAAHIYRW